MKLHASPQDASETAYLPGEAYDEMFAPGGITRANYRLLDQDIQALGNPQVTLKRIRSPGRDPRYFLSGRSWAITP
jgi:hypothetical protein